MIAKMREWAPIVMWIVIITFVGTIFFAWGMDITGRGQRYVAGKIDGKEIPLDYFDRQVNLERERLEQRGESATQAQEYRMAPRQVWEREVSQILLGKLFTTMKLGASAEEVYAHLKANPPGGIDTMEYFRTDGVFDTSKYVQFLNNPAIYDDPGMQQTEVYTQNYLLPMQKLETLLKAGVAPSRSELARAYRETYERGVFEYAVVFDSRFGISPEEVTDAAVTAFYRAHQDTFAREEQAELYFVKLPKSVSAGDEKLYYDELLQLKSRILEGEITFTAEAGVESDDPGSARNGGDLGWFGRGAMVPEFEQAAFALEAGKMSDPVRTSFGYHLILVEERRGKADKEEVHARHILRKVAPTIETLDSLKDMADSIRTAAIDQGLAAVAAQSALPVDSTGLFEKGKPVGKIGFLSGLSRFVFQGNEGDIPEQVFEDTDAFYVFQIKRKSPKGILPIGDAREFIVRTLTAGLQREKARAFLEKTLAAHGENKELAALKDTDSLLTAGVTDTVTRAGYIPPVGMRNEAITAAFVLPVGKRSVIYDIAGGCCVVRPLWQGKIESIPWDSPLMAQVSSNLAMEQQQRLYAQWFLDLKNKADITSHLDKYYLD